MNIGLTLPKTIKVWSRGQLTIPREIREKTGLDEGGVVNIFSVGSSLVITPKKLLRPSLSKQVEESMRQQKITLKELLADLKKQRATYNKEKYGI